MDPVQNAKFEAELQALKDSLKSISIENPSDEISEEKVLSSWRTLEQGNIARENKIADHNRAN